jgi:tetratricopeptide (TPR) repeat protein
MLPDPSLVELPVGRVRRSWLTAGLVAALALAAYHNSFSGALVFDDQSTIIDNPSIRALWPPWVVFSPPPAAGVGGRPLANVTFALNYAVSGRQPWSYHALNLALHALAALVLFGVVRRTLLLPALRDRCGEAAWALALTTAALWAVHPVPTAAVNYVSQRTELLMALCYLLTFFGFVRAAECHLLSDNTVDRGGAFGWAALAVGACALGMASKEAMVTAPVLVLLFDRTFVAGTFRAAWRGRWRFYLALAATWLVLAHLMFWSPVAERGVGFCLGVPWIDYALTQCRAVVLYLKLAVWPQPLVFDYGWDFVRTAGAAAPFAMVLTALLAATGWALWRRPAAGFAAAAFLIVLVPTSSVVPIIQQPIAESRVYLPLATVVVLATLGLHRLLGRRLWFVAPVAALGFVAITVDRNAAYRSEVALWADTVVKQPASARAHGCLGAALLRVGRTDEAVKPLERAVQLRPEYAEARQNLVAAITRQGQARLQAGDADAARTRFEAALRLEPDYAPAHNDLGIALLQAGRVTEAVTHGETAVRLRPNFAEAQYNLGNALAQAGRTDAAIAAFEAAVRLAPDFAKAHNNLGALLLRAGRVAEAIAQFETTLRLDPVHAGARRNLDFARTLSNR